MADEGPTDPPVPTDEDDLDAVLHLLSASERRQTIRVLQAVEAPIATADLAREIAALQAPPATTDDVLEAAERLQESLYHVHLPKLAAADVVDLATDRNTVAPGDDFEPAAAVLQLIDEPAADE